MHTSSLPTLRKGDIVTVIGLGFIAQTTRQTVYATGEYTTKDGLQTPIFKDSSRSRKKFTLRPFEKDQLVFVNLPPTSLRLDSELTLRSESGMTTTLTRGNACFNFVTDDIPALKEVIEDRNKNTSFTAFDRVLAYPSNGDDVPTPVYPDVPTNAHPVIRIRENLNVL